MPVNGVQQFIADTIDGTTSPFLPDLTARVMPPQVDDIGAPKAYVWGSRWQEKRFTTSRGRYDGDAQYLAGSGGQKRLDYQVSVWVTCAMNAGVQNVDQGFPILLERVAQRLRAVPNVTNIIDPTTQVRSALLAIGEEFHVEYTVPVTLSDQRYVRQSAKITVICFEILFS